MGKNKFYTVEKEINGVNYVAQFSGLSCAMKAIDTTYIEGTSTTCMEDFAGYILENVIVEPAGLTIDDFDTMDDLNAVVKFGREVMQGKFRDKAADKAATKK